MTHERRVLALVGAAQFVQVLDFTLVLPLGPDLCGPLHVPVASLAWLVAAYSGAAAVSGLLAARFLDGLGRRRALCVALLGLVLANLAAAAASSFAELLLARAFAGVCGGPALSLAHAIVTDLVAPRRRGRAFGAVLGANALAAVVGVPAALHLASGLGWWAPFVALAGLGALVVLMLALALPPMQAALEPELERGPGPASPWRREARLAYALVFIVVVAALLLAPNLSAYVQHNLAVPRSRIPGLYMIAGLVSFVSMRVVGRAVDHHGAFVTGGAALLVFVLLALPLLVVPIEGFPVELGFVILMAAMSSRNVAVRALTTRVPEPREVARFLSLQTSVQQLAAMSGALLGLVLLSDGEDGRLLGMPVAAALAITMSCVALVLLRQLERLVGDTPQR